MSTRGVHEPADEGDRDLGSEVRSDAALQRAIDASLRRTFAPPASLRLPPALARDTGPSPARRAASRPALTRAATWAALAAAAALVLVVTRFGGEEEPEPGRLVRLPPQAQDVPEERVAAGIPDEVEVVVPDLERLYAQVVERPPTLVACLSPAELRDSHAGLRAMLDARYGPEVRMKPEAETVLQGPFPSSEWPSGTIFASLVAGAPSVLIAERTAHVRCCVQVDLPVQSPLRVFTWTYGDMQLTELTTLDEPRLIDLFETP